MKKSLIAKERKASRQKTRRLKKVLIRERGNKCERCGAPEVQLHHKNHDRRINTRENCILLCDKCHKHEHEIDKRQTDYSRPPTHYLGE